MRANPILATMIRVRAWVRADQDGRCSEQQADVCQCPLMLPRLLRRRLLLKVLVSYDHVPLCNRNRTLRLCT